MRIKAGWTVFLLVLIGSLAHAGEQPMSQGQGWSSLTSREQGIYIVGYRDGSFWTWIEAKWACPASADQVKRAVLEIAFTPEAIANVMTDLYRDPANKFIRPENLVLIAAKKLRGERIEDDLLKARASAHNKARED